MIPPWLGTLVKILVLPPMSPLLVAVVGLAMLVRHPRAGRAMVLGGVIALWLLATPAVSGLLVRYLGDTRPLDLATGRNAQAIVILGGGTRRFAAEYGRPSVGSITLERIRYGAWLARATHLPILVSGGSVRGAPREALLMRDVLVREFDVPVRWVEARSRNTHENAIESAKILAGDGVSRVILVGHAFDFPRSRKEFEAAGIDVIAAPIDIPPAIPTEVGDFLPGARGLLESYYACYEIFANVAFDLTRKFASGAVSGSFADTRATHRSPSPLPRAP